MSQACYQDTDNQMLRIERIAAWLADERAARFPADATRLTIWVDNSALSEEALNQYDRQTLLPGGWRLSEVEPIECAIAPVIASVDRQGRVRSRTGAYLYRFIAAEGDTAPVEVMIAGTATDEHEPGWVVAACDLPRAFLVAWEAFAEMLDKLAMKQEPDDEIMIIGGRERRMKPEVRWEDVILPAALKDDLMHDVHGFFTKGVEVYRRLRLKPFRKLLLAGVPGTGKTMLCMALAKWALEQHYLVIYISSSGRWRSGDEDGASFEKIDHALNVAAESEVPTLIIVEELDIYLRPEHKALILNVLDGSEAPLNPHGTLLISTTNYPEAIDERVLKRPGRLDRIFIIPEMRAAHDAEAMLRACLGDLWDDSHRAIVRHLVGYPGAFIREVVVHALTQAAYAHSDNLSLALLEESFRRLRDQIEARDDLLLHRGEVGFNVKPNLG
jgi:hypothetical protein